MGWELLFTLMPNKDNPDVYATEGVVSDMDPIEKSESPNLTVTSSAEQKIHENL